MEILSVDRNIDEMLEWWPAYLL